jgi:hypothetical protein
MKRLILILFFFIIAIPSVKSITVINRLSDLGEWYLHSEPSDLKGCRQWSISQPDNVTTITTKVSGVSYIDQWCTPSSLTTSSSIQLLQLHNWLSKIYVKNDSTAEGHLFFRLYLYNGTKKLIFTSTSSNFVNATNNLFSRYVWQSIDDNDHVLSSGDRMIVELYFNTTKSGFLTIGIDSNSTPSSITDPTEIRYMDSTSSGSVNGLNVYAFRTSYTEAKICQVPLVNTYPTLCTGYWGIRTWKRNSTGTETEITSGSPVARVNFTLAGSTYKSNTYSVSTTALSSTDSIVARVYISICNQSLWQQINYAVFTTEQLGAIQLNSSTWTVRYNIWIDKHGTPPSETYTYYYCWVINTNPDTTSEVDNFVWLPTTTTTTTSTTSTTTTSTTTSTTTISAPRWSLNSTNDTTACMPISFNLNWTAVYGSMSRSVLSIANGTSVFVNTTWCTFPSTTWCNVTVIVNCTDNALIQWKQYANNTGNKWNTSSTFTFRTVTTTTTSTTTTSTTTSTTTTTTSTTTSTTTESTTTSIMIQPTKIKSLFECERKICYENLKLTPKINRIVECDLENEYPYFLIFEDTKDLLWQIVCEK